MSGKVKVSRHALSFGTKFATTLRRLFVQRGRAGEKRGRMPVVAQAEQNQIVPVNHFAFLHC